MSYVEPKPAFSPIRLVLWLVNIPVGLFVFYIGLYAFLGGWMSEEAESIWPLFLLLPIIASVAWIASYRQWREGSRKVANLLLLMPLASILVVFALAGLL